MKKLLITVALLIALAGIGLGLLPRQDARPAQPRSGFELTTLLEDHGAGFARADGPWQFAFPDDHGAHPAFRTESWYFRGNLVADTERRFGFQLTFFRLALQPEPPPSPSAWATNQVYRAHLALTDRAQNQFRAFERFSRAALGLSGATKAPARVWLENWAAESLTDSGGAAGFHLSAATDDITLDLRLHAQKPPVLSADTDLIQGATGSRGGLHFFLMTRMRAEGVLRIGAETFQVQGMSWLDRAWGDMTGPRGQIALNRFTLQLDDDREIMCLQLHRRDGSGKPVSTGLLVLADGSNYRLDRRDMTLDALDYWESPRDGVRYPARWRLGIPAEQMELEIVPYVADQEMDLSVRYWAGAVAITGQAGGQPVSGAGHVELTGYADGTLPI
jgi:predicted secreted hydrolase